MGQKVNPLSLRTGPHLYKNWESVFYAEKNYSDLLIQDISIRRLVLKHCVQAQVSKVFLLRVPNSLIVNIHAKKTGVIIGKSGTDIDKLKKLIGSIFSGEIYINIHEVKRPNIDATIVAGTIASQLQKRVSFRKAMKNAMQLSFRQGAQGIKVSCAGRLGGAEIARTEWYMEGRVPLHTLRANIDYAIARADTTYGVIGVKVWIYKGDYTSNQKNITNSGIN